MHHTRCGETWGKRLRYSKLDLQTCTCVDLLIPPALFDSHVPGLGLNHFAEASFRGIIRVARNVIEDIGAEAASSSGGLTQLAAISLDHSERDGHQLLGKAGLSVQVPLAMLGSRELNLDFPIIPLRHWAQWLANSHNLHILVGLQAPDDRREGEILKAFWDGYRQLFPQHTIFNHFDSGAADPGLRYPITFHGDEGRGRLRLGFLVTNYHSYLGRGTDAARTQCPQRYIKLRPNFWGTLKQRDSCMLLCRRSCTKRMGFSTPSWRTQPRRRST